MAFTKLQIGNRALQKLGQGSSGRLFEAAAAEDDVSDDVSGPAAAINLCYNPLRETELQSNYWAFAIKRQVIRKVDPDNDKIITAATYAGGTTYDKNDLVLSDGIVYVSLVGTNLGNTPVSSPVFWAVWWGVLVAVLVDTGLVYYRGELVYTGSTLFMALKNTTQNVAPAEGTEWHEVNTATLAATPYVTPLFARHFAFLKPRDFLRIAPQEPKYSQIPTDWLVEGNFIITSDPGPMFLRYVRNEKDPATFNPLFVEGLACKIAENVCEEVTQSNTKKADAVKLYDRAIYRARITNAIEIGPVEPDEDELITCRR